MVHPPACVRGRRRTRPAGATVAVAVAIALLAGCATLKPSEAPGCSGARRPANPYGSVLAPDVKALPEAPAGQCLGGAR